MEKNLITKDNIALLEFRDLKYGESSMKLAIIDGFIILLCSEYSGKDYEAVRIDFRISGGNIKEVKGKPIRGSKSVGIIFRHGWLLEDLNSGVELTDTESSQINFQINDYLNKLRLEFLLIK